MQKNEAKRSKPTIIAIECIRKNSKMYNLIATNDFYIFEH